MITNKSSTFQLAESKQTIDFNKVENYIEIQLHAIDPNLKITFTRYVSMNELSIKLSPYKDKKQEILAFLAKIDAHAPRVGDKLQWRFYQPQLDKLSNVERGSEQNQEQSDKQQESGALCLVM